MAESDRGEDGAPDQSETLIPDLVSAIREHTGESLRENGIALYDLIDTDTLRRIALGGSEKNVTFEVVEVVVELQSNGESVDIAVSDGVDVTTPE